MNLLVKSFLRNAIAAAAIVLFFFLRGMTDYPVWIPVLVAGLICFVLELFGASNIVVSIAFLVIAAASVFGFAGNGWSVAGVFAFSKVFDVLEGLGWVLAKLYNGKKSAAPAAPSK